MCMTAETKPVPQYAGFSDAMIEAASRKLCLARGIDPDQWRQVADEVISVVQVMDAVESVRWGM